MRVKNIIFLFSGLTVDTVNIYYFVYGNSESLCGINTANDTEKNWIYSQITQ